MLFEISIHILIPTKVKINKPLPLYWNGCVKTAVLTSIYIRTLQKKYNKEELERITHANVTTVFSNTEKTHTHTQCSNENIFTNIFSNQKIIGKNIGTFVTFLLKLNHFFQQADQYFQDIKPELNYNSRKEFLFLIKKRKEIKTFVAPPQI